MGTHLCPSETVFQVASNMGAGSLSRENSLCKGMEA